MTPETGPVRPVRCSLCEGSRYYLVYEDRRSAPSTAKSGYTISESDLEKPDKVVRCMTCGLVYALPKESAQEIREDYQQMVDEGYLREERGRREQARIILSRFPLKRDGKLLDVGCGPGFFLDEARKAGWDVRGADLSEWAREHCRDRYGIEVFTGTLEEARYPDRSFDAVVMNDFIEHVTDPRATLREARRILKNDGVLYISTPDIDSLLSRVLGARWWGINKYHLYYFSRRTLEKMFSAVGLRRVRYSSYPRVFSAAYWAQRLEPYPAFVSVPGRWLAGLLGERLIKVDLQDQIGVVARKVQRLDSLYSEEDETPPAPVGRPKVIAVLPAYNAERTLERTVADIPREVVDQIVLVDDKSRDRTVEIARRLGLHVVEHAVNKGYGGNQKTCYDTALSLGADIVVMVHPDYQYDPKIIPRLIEPIRAGQADAVFGSRMMKGGALEGGMPLWKHNANILLTALENVILGTYLTEYHSGFRAYSARLLRTVRYREDSDGFVFDTEIIVQALANHFKIEEVPIRTRYFEEASSIRLWPSIVYGLGILRVLTQYALHRSHLLRQELFEPAARPR
ncbi:MAG: Ubiquinone biosynthesis O-methyltransferase [Candidatus Omnitrophica bacterium]|nr:Ubiquinone biosynthesis O-methyltransferase [Candidatus Omnitrophota bacterium]